MWHRIMSWFKDTCPICHEDLICEESGVYCCTVKVCPEGHYRLERHALIGVPVEHRLE